MKTYVAVRLREDKYDNNAREFWRCIRASRWDIVIILSECRKHPRYAEIVEQWKLNVAVGGRFVQL